jgi:hypothetical protein
VRNYGNVTEAQFPVEMRVGNDYRRRVVFDGPISPGATMIVGFPAWEVQAGVSAVTCSTALWNDCRTPNDRLDTSCLGATPLTLLLGDDRTDRILYGETKNYQFFAEPGGADEAHVEVRCSDIEPGWQVELLDAGGRQRLVDSDGDGWPDLGDVQAGSRAFFTLRVTAIRNPMGDTSGYAAQSITIDGRLEEDSTIADAVTLDLEPVPTLHIHNFPNPFSGATTFVIALPTSGDVDLVVYTRNGERVRRLLDRDLRSAGVWLVPWDGMNDHGRAVADGTYEYLLTFRHSGVTDLLRKRLVVAGE